LVLWNVLTQDLWKKHPALGGQIQAAFLLFSKLSSTALIFLLFFSLHREREEYAEGFQERFLESPDVRHARRTGGDRERSGVPGLEAVDFSNFID
jgi:hypothetical protein